MSTETTTKVFSPSSLEELKDALHKYLDIEHNSQEYSEIDSWDTSLIKDISYLF